MIFAIIQARMGSNRLPGKVLMPIGEKPAIMHVIERTRLINKVDKVILATTTEKKDDGLYSFCIENGIDCFRGSEDDVLDRYYRAALNVNAKDDDYVIRITGDCPFIDPEICESVIELIIKEDADYASNVIIPSFPSGLDCEVFKFSVLKDAHQNAKYDFEREHVTAYIRLHPEKYILKNFSNKTNMENERWTLDTKEDYNFLNSIYNGIGKEYFHMDEITKYLSKHPELYKMISHIGRNTAIKKSLKEAGLQDKIKV